MGDADDIPMVRDALETFRPMGVVGLHVVVRGPPVQFFTTFPAADLARYVDERSWERDPVFRRGMLQPYPFRIHDDSPAWPRTAEEREQVAKAAAAGRPDGVCVPVLSGAPRGVRGFVSWVCGGPAEEARAKAVDLLALFPMSLTGLSYDLLAEIERRKAGALVFERVYAVNPEQARLLELVVAGKSHDVMATILRIPSGRVRDQLRWLRSTFRVADRYQLATVAVLSGLA